MSRLSTVDVAAVRLWLDARVYPETPSNVMAGFDEGVGATFFDLNTLQVCNHFNPLLIISSHSSTVTVRSLSGVAVIETHHEWPAVLTTIIQVPIPLTAPPDSPHFETCLSVPVSATQPACCVTYAHDGTKHPFATLLATSTSIFEQPLVQVHARDEL